LAYSRRFLNWVPERAVARLLIVDGQQRLDYHELLPRRRRAAAAVVRDAFSLLRGGVAAPVAEAGGTV
jgi:hypothetical protein